MLSAFQDQLRQCLLKAKAFWKPKTLEPPQVDPTLPELPPLQRSAESLRYTTLQTEYWISAGGALREWLRLNCIVAIVIGIPAFLVVPIITFLLHQFQGWTSLLVAIGRNLLIFPVIAILAVALVTAILFAAKLIFVCSKH